MSQRELPGRRSSPLPEDGTTMHVRRVALAIVVLVLAMPALAGAGEDHQPAAASLLTSGLSGTIGSTIGPDRALYVPEGTLGRITRIDRRSGEATTFASGLPP